MQKVILWLVLIVFAVLTAVAVMQYGVIGIIQYQLANAAGVQVLADLTIALVLFLVWMWRDAHKRGVSPGLGWY